MANANASLSSSLGGSSIIVHAPSDLPGSAGNGIPVALTHGSGSATVRANDSSFELFIGSSALSVTDVVNLINSAGTNWSADVDLYNLNSWTNDDSGQSTSTSGGTDAATTGVGSSHGTGTATGVGASTARSVGSAAGTTPTAAAHSGNDGSSHGTGTATGVGAYTVASVGNASGTSTAAALTGLRQAVGVAAGTSTTNSTLPLAASRRTTLDHVQASIDRLPEYAKEAAHA